MIRAALLALAAALLGLAALLGGAAPFGRVALGFGLPGLAARLFDDPAWRGVALYRVGDVDAAAGTLAGAGPEAAFNLGNAEVRRGAYAAALEAYDLAMAWREDAEARANFDLVRAFWGGTPLEAGSVARWDRKREGATQRAATAEGAGRASGTGDEVTNTGANPGLPSLQSEEQLGVRRVFDDRFIAAGPRWLATLEDVPGAYLAARIAQEHKDRRAAGTGQAPEDTEW